MKLGYQVPRRLEYQNEAEEQWHLPITGNEVMHGVILQTKIDHRSI